MKKPLNCRPASGRAAFDAFTYSVSHDLQAPLRRIEERLIQLKQVNVIIVEDSEDDLLPCINVSGTIDKKLPQTVERVLPC